MVPEMLRPHTAKSLFTQAKPEEEKSIFDNCKIYVLIMTIVAMTVGSFGFMKIHWKVCVETEDQGTNYSLKEICENDEAREELATEYHHFSTA